MSFRYHVDFDVGKRLESQDRNEQNFLMSRLLKGLHMAIVQECGEGANKQDVIAVAFPLASPGSHGGLLRAFSNDSAVLGRLLRHPSIYRYVGMLGAVVREVPPVDRHASFFRDRSDDRYSPSARRRARKRQRELDFKVHPKLKERTGFCLEVCSGSSGQTFLMRIQRLETEEAHLGGFNAYGLSRESSVPAF